MILEIISGLSLVCSIFALVRNHRTSKKLERINRPLIWNIEVCPLRPGSHALHRERIQEYTNLAAENIFQLNTPNLIDNRTDYAFQWKVIPYTTPREPADPNSLNYIYIKNNSNSRISIDEFQKGQDRIYSGYGIDRDTSVLIILEAYHQPEKMLINFSGTILPYDLTNPNSTGNAIRPQEPI